MVIGSYNATIGSISTNICANLAQPIEKKC